MKKNIRSIGLVALISVAIGIGGHLGYTRDKIVAKTLYKMDEQTKIAFISEMGMFGSYEIYIMNADGSEQKQLTNNPEIPLWFPGDCPSWSPDGKKIVFTLKNGFYIINADETKQTRLTKSLYYGTNPCWSPDGKKIVFDRKALYKGMNIIGNYEIYIMNVDGTEQKRLTNNTAMDANPSWSPDGKKITFYSNRDKHGNNEIYVMNADGGKQTRLTNNPAYDWFPSWSPDGKKIAFRSERDGNEEIYVMNADGTEQKNLTNNPAFDKDPSWSPDGKKIAFYSTRDKYGNGEIYVMNADGSEQKRLTNRPHTLDFYPSWSPFIKTEK